MGSASGQHLLKYAINRKDPSELAKPQQAQPISKQPGVPLIGEGGKDSPRLDVDEQSIFNEIPISKFKPNHLSKRREMNVKVIASEEFKDDMN